MCSSVNFRSARYHARTGVALAAFAWLLALVGDSTPNGALADEPTVSSVKIGVANHFKVGHWTRFALEVERTGNGEAAPAGKELRASVTAPDNDGVAVTASADVRALGDQNESNTTVYTNVGKLRGDITIALSENDRRIESHGARALIAENTDLTEMPATSELVLFLGEMPVELVNEYTSRNESNGLLARKGIQVASAETLPESWIGYDGIDVIYLNADDSELTEGLTSNAERFAALARWIELGGRLVISCSGRSAERWLTEGQPLATLAPGRYIESVRLPETGRLENFAGTEAPIAGRGPRTTIVVPRLADVPGQIEVFAGRQATDLPLVVRTIHGLGEVTFVGVNINAPPLAQWSGRSAFLQALLRPYVSRDSANVAGQTLVTRGYSDLSGALRQRLGRSFQGVAIISFSIVALLAIAYMALLGPIDYFIVRRWLGRSFAAWYTFPLIVLTFTGGALALANWRHGSGKLQLNQIEVVDFDAESRLARGTVWSAIYSPNATKLDLCLKPMLGRAPVGNTEVLLASWGLPGAGVGGTQGGGYNPVMGDEGYRLLPERNGLVGVPVLPSGTKSFLGRWSANVPAAVIGELSSRDGMPAGLIENRGGHPLRNIRLFYGEWGYRLGSLEAGGRLELGDGLSPRGVRTIVTQDSLGVSAQRPLEGAVFSGERASLREIVNLMMFYDAAGGFGFAQLSDNYQPYCDLSRAIQLGKAVLVAEVEGPGSRLMEADNGSPTVAEPSESVIYRILMPVRSE